MTYLKNYLILFLCFISFYNVSSQDVSELKGNIKEAELANDSLSMARAWYKLGVYCETNQRIPESTQAFHRALFWANSIHSDKAVSSIANYLASNFSLSGQVDSSIYYYNLALKACVSMTDSARMPVVMVNLADEYSNQGDYVKAANYGISAIRIKEQQRDSSNLAFFYQKIGEIYKVAGEKEEWEKYIQEAYKLIHHEGYASISAIAAIYNDLGGIAEYNQNYSQALLYYDTLINVGENNDFPKAIGVALKNRATIFRIQGKNEKALENALKSKDYIKDEGYHKITSDNLLSELYLSRENPDEALNYAMLALDNKKIDNYVNEKLRSFKNLYQIEKQLANFKEALSWNEKYMQLSDSISDTKIRTKIADLEISYQTEKKEQRIALLTAENQVRKQRIVLFITTLIVLVMVLLSGIFVSVQRKKQSLLREETLRHKLLRSQMNPHFLFNALGSIQNFMYKNETRKAAGYLNNFAELARATLEHSSKELINLSDEIVSLHNYLKLEQMRAQNSFIYEINYPEDMDTEFIKIPPMFIQPFVENSIKHGLNKISYPGRLDIEISETMNSIEIVIKDNGKGLDTGGITGGTAGHNSMAMKIFEERRQLIQQKYKTDFGFEIQNRKEINPLETGVRIMMRIPILE